MTTTQDKKGQYLSINLGFALGVTFGVFVSRGVSGEGLRENYLSSGERKSSPEDEL